MYSAGAARLHTVIPPTTAYTAKSLSAGGLSRAKTKQAETDALPLNNPNTLRIPQNRADSVLCRQKRILGDYPPNRMGEWG